MDTELHLCSIDARYLKFLHSVDYRVSVKYNNRPFVGFITMLNGINYVIPLTSQTTAERAKNGKGKRSARMTTFIRDSSGVEIANLLHNNMIPVPDNAYTILQIDATKNTYETNEIRFVRKHKEDIIKKAKKVYSDRLAGKDLFLCKHCCDFAKLESASRRFQQNS
ncbi:MAG: type III toxin-antitoxin system ToxN/AbiQ family toxin [Eubacterium sp.]|nr:type III toxin-antitoxin system ToxN/AbiQ family toxin [Eubacterium sp.]